MPYASQRIPQQISCLLGGSFTIEDPPGSTSLGSFSRPLTPMHFSGFSGQIPHQVTLGAQGESSSPTLSQSRLQACPGGGGGEGPGESRGPYHPLLPAASFPFYCSDRYPAPTHQPVPTWGPCTGGWGVLKRGEKLAPSPTLGWKNQRGSIPKERGGGLGLCKGAAEIPVRGRQRH